jgi:hypothetical protein
MEVQWLTDVEWKSVVRREPDYTHRRVKAGCHDLAADVCRPGSATAPAYEIERVALR